VDDSDEEDPFAEVAHLTSNAILIISHSFRSTKDSPKRILNLISNATNMLDYVLLSLSSSMSSRPPRQSSSFRMHVIRS